VHGWSVDYCVPRATHRGQRTLAPDSTRAATAAAAAAHCVVRVFLHIAALTARLLQQDRQLHQLATRHRGRLYSEG
jgi:hypothetical protein